MKSTRAKLEKRGDSIPHVRKLRKLIAALLTGLVFVFPFFATYNTHSDGWSVWCAEIGLQTSTVTVWTEDFEGAFPASWVVSDTDTNSGLDYWDCTNYRSYLGSRSGWCAQAGVQNDTGELNSDIHRYDDNMDALMYRSSIAQRYDSARVRALSLSYWYWLECEEKFDFLKVMYFDGSYHYIDSHTGNSSGWQSSTVSIPTSAIFVGFRFTSDSTLHNYEGAYVDDVIFTATIDRSIYIRADGSIDPPTANITTADNFTYTFDGSVDNSVLVERDNIVIDGEGHTVQGTRASGSKGIDLTGRSNVTIKNMAIEAFDYGIYLYSSSNNSLSGNNIANSYYGIYLSSSSNNSLSGNNITANNYYGIWLARSIDNTINENVVVDGKWGIILEDSGNNTLRNNNMTDNDYNFGVAGSISFPSTINDIDTSNTVNGKPVYYLINQHDLIINPSTFPEVGYLGLVNSTNITVENLVMTHNRHGVLFAYTNDSTIRNVEASNNYWGICLYAAVNNTIENVTATNNEYVGIQLYYSDNSVISRSLANNTSEGIRVYYSASSTVSDNVVANNRYGVYVYRSSNIALGSNIMVNNTYGFYVYGSNMSEFVNDDITDNRYGIFLSSCSNSDIMENNITNIDEYGIYLSSSSYNNISRNTLASNGEQGIWLLNSSHNRISGNSMIGNHDGIELRSSSDNYIYHNNFVNNAIQVVTNGSLNAWDDGYPSGGNYWSDYAGVDLYNGAYQNETGFDWIGDAAYIVDQNNTDRYPLMRPFVRETEEARMAYRSLLLRFSEVNSRLGALNSKVNELFGSVDTLNAAVNDMKEEIKSLNSTCRLLQEQINSLPMAFNTTSDSLQRQIQSLNTTWVNLNQSVSNLQNRIDSLNSTQQTSIDKSQGQYNSLSNELNNIQNTLYVFMGITFVLIATTVYLVTRKQKTKPET
jgi:parallel beta-helix repeat protein